MKKRARPTRLRPNVETDVAGEAIAGHPGHAARAATPVPPTAVRVERAVSPIPWWAWLLGLVFIVGAGLAAGALVYKHFNNIALPGCKPGSACDMVDTHILGRILLPEGLAKALKFGKWPVSFLGFTYYAAILAAWVVSWRRIAPGLRWMIRLGALVSVGYMVAIVIADKYCKYCIASHVANFALLGCSEIGSMMARRNARVDTTAATSNRATRRSGAWSLAAFAVVFAGVTGWLGASKHAAGMVEEAKREESERKMLEQIREQERLAAERQAAEKAKAGPEAWDFGPKGFTGRWRMGPEKAQVRIVLFGAYTCKFCREMERIAVQLVNANPGKVSFSFKHYPMNSGCNAHMKKGEDPAEHRNACWAARCAEACAIWAGGKAVLKGEDQWTAGNEAYWKAHEWLYGILGEFNDDSLIAGLKQHGFDDAAVTELMTKEAANKPVVSDAAEGHALGLYQTPTIYINGVELFGWQQPGALQSAVSKLLAANAPALDASGDRPILAREKAVAEWRANPVTAFGADQVERALGKADAPVVVVMFGDFQEENTQKADKIIRSWLAGPGGTGASDAAARPVRYVFRHFPGDQACNPTLQKTFFPQGCMMARAAEAAGAVGGEGAYWKMHEWLVNNPSPMSLDSVKKGARAIGLDGDAVLSSLNKPEVTAAIADDVAAAQAIGVDQIPKIYINGKFVKTWTREGDNVLERIVDEAAAKK